MKFLGSLKLQELKKVIGNLKKEGKTVGLCCGGYDLLHAGHIMHFNSAKKLCDVLVAAVTCDKFVNKRKGPYRPIFNEEQRAYMVSNIKAVDFTVISPYKTAVELIKIFKPDYYIKGPDYINKDTPGIAVEREAMRSIGGEILYTKDEKLSTTDIINRILENK